MSADGSITNLPDAVAALGALPMPVGTEPQADPVAAGRGLDLLALMDERVASVVSPVLAGVLDEAERLRGEVATLSQALSDAAEALRAKESSADSYAVALPWAALMDDEDLSEFLDELADAATTNVDAVTRLAEVERACSTWRLIGEAQHGHNTAPGPDAASQSFAERAGRETDPGRRVAWRMLAADVPEGEHYAAVHHTYRLGHDLPETGGA